MESIEDLKLINPNEYFEVIQNKDKLFKSFISNSKIKQIDLYCLLKNKFGKPNGIQSFLRANDSDNFINWHFSFQYKKIFIDILGSIRFLEFQMVSIDQNEFNNFDVDNFVSLLNENIKIYSNQIKKEKDNLEYWDIFLNTYKRLKITINKFYSDYSKIKIKEPIIFKTHILTKSQFRIYQNQLKKLTTSTIEKKNYGIVLRMLFPVLGESLINLVIFTLARDEIKNDNRLLDNVFRSQIDIRIKTLHINCNGIIEPYNQNDECFKNFLRLMDKRNDFLHGNILPKNNCFDTVYFDGTIPIFNEEKDITVEFIKQNLYQVNEDEINNDYNTINLFTDFLIKNISSPFREQMEIILEKSDLGYNKKTNRIGILFNDNMVQGFLIKNK